MTSPPERIEVEGGTSVTLTWEGGVVTRFTARRLRDGCLCADCQTRRDAAPRKIRLTVLGEEASIRHAELVGDYGIRFVFGPDGHQTGIFTWEMLAEADSAGTRT